MIRLLVRIGMWLDRRFPETVTVSKAEYDKLHARIADVEIDLGSKMQEIDTIISRLSTVEMNAVHKGAVSDVVAAVQALKDDVVSLKANLGMNRVLANKELQIMLSGENINAQE